MILERRSILKPLIESSGGVHLSAYLSNNGKLPALKSQIKEVIAKAEPEIRGAMSAAERRHFLAPLRLLLNSQRLLSKMRHNIGLFRTSKSFRILALPIDVEPASVVATSFHVKPLLRWLRVDKDFLLLGIENQTAKLYHGTQHSLSLVDTLELSEPLVIKLPSHLFANSVSRSLVQPDQIELLANWVSRHTLLSKPKLFFAGNPKVLRALKKQFFYPHWHSSGLSELFSPDEVPALSFEVRVQLETEAMLDFDQLLTEFHFAEQNRRARRNIFQMAQGVLAKGGEVIVATRAEIPERHFAWALLDSPSIEAERPVGEVLRGEK
jgi:hypothetical protein